jgi:hypothetical protein
MDVSLKAPDLCPGLSLLSVYRRVPNRTASPCVGKMVMATVSGAVGVVTSPGPPVRVPARVGALTLEFAGVGPKERPRPAKARGLMEVDPLRPCKSPASPTVNEFGSRDVGKSQPVVSAAVGALFG